MRAFYVRASITFLKCRGRYSVRIKHSSEGSAISKHCAGRRAEHSNPPAGGYTCFEIALPERVLLQSRVFAGSLKSRQFFCAKSCEHEDLETSSKVPRPCNQCA